MLLTDCKKFRPLDYGFGQCQIGALHPRAGLMNFSTRLDDASNTLLQMWAAHGEDRDSFGQEGRNSLR